MFFFIGAGAIVAGVAGGGGGGGIGSIALAHGLALAVAVSTFGALSGGHFNPAVTFGLAVAGKHPWPRVPTYWAAQLVGALAAGAALRYAFDFGPAVAAGFYDNWFVYWIGPLVGAAVAGLSYRYVFAPPEGRAPAIVSAPPV